jgi:hypothetical protein
MKLPQTVAPSPLRDVPLRLYKFCMGVGSLLPAVGLLIFLAPKFVWACACGCSIFDVGTPSLLPNGAGGTVWLEYDFQNQYINWHATQPSAYANNSDKQIKTHFFTAGGQYMFNRDWGAMVTVPYTARIFQTEGATPNQIDQYRHANFGDVRVWGMYTGLLEDMSLGLLAGFKLPTGDHTYNDFDRDTSIGTGSTDLLVGAYKIGNFPKRISNLNLTFRERPFNYYLQVQYEYPFRSTGNYTPGKEFDGSLGAFYDFGHVGVLHELAPFLSFLGSVRTHDLGSEADTPNSGYDRLHIAPGGEIGWKGFKLYTDVEFPLYQYVDGNQLTAPYLIKTILSYSF